MRKVITILAVLAAIYVTIAPADAAVKVRGYHRRNGTYVQPHYRSNPDGNPYNNWSTRGNVNPYTGKRGTRRIGYMSNLNTSSSIQRCGTIWRRPIKLPSPLPGPTFPSFDSARSYIF